MSEYELKEIEKRLGIKLPFYYKETMLDYPFSANSFAYEFTLCTDYERIIDYNGVFRKDHNSFVIGSDGGEYIFFIKLNGDSTVYVFDLENSQYDFSIEANSLDDYLNKLKVDEERIAIDMEEDRLRRRNRKWWQFWR